MNNLNIAFRNTLRNKGNNFIKILSLAIGLTVGLVLIAKVVFELSFDRFYPDNDRIYQVYSNYGYEGEEMEPYERTSGAIAWGMKNEINEVENSTRYTFIGEGVYTEKKEFLSAEIIIADENLFDVLQRPILIGNAKEILSMPMQCLVSRTIAEKIGMDDIVGKTITLSSQPYKPVVISGVFEDIPENANVLYDIVISLKSIDNFTWDGSENWLGNDRYYSYVKLSKGVKPESISEQIWAMQERHQDMEELSKAGVNIGYFLVDIKDVHTNDETVRLLILVFSVLAIVLLLTSILNYTLIVVSSLVNRTKEIAVHKCYGASGFNISRLMFLETFIHLILALILSSTAIILLKNTIEKLLDTSLQALFAPQIIFILFIVCAIIFIISGFLPSYLFSKIPVAAAFQRARESHRRWKIVLIFIEVAATSFLITLLFIIGLQYNKMINKDQGYSFENVLYVEDHIDGVQVRDNIAQELRKLSDVKEVSQCYWLPIWGASGNNVFEIGEDKQLFNIADFYFVDENYLSLLEIPIIEGRNFVRGESGLGEMLVSESFITMMEETAGWKDGVVGKSVHVTEHGTQTIIGVFGELNLSTSGMDKDDRPAVLFYDQDGKYGPEYTYNFLIKMHRVTPGIMENVAAVFRAFAPDEHVVIKSYEEEFKKGFSMMLTFRRGVLICSIITLLIALIGLIGYLNDETNRRRSEIAIRKINGATIKDIQGLFITNILKTIIPAVIIGIIAAIFAANSFMKNFAEKAHLSFILYVLCAVCIVAIILAVVSINSYKASVRNPMENLAKD
ncbi:ABC transporter permease [Bacteroidales bacterium OttesenSCG-928-K03]|nr:ABC transporter permease [Bacteroidales bacterium OttesenSCG-928-L14]MDL2240248.1 ABC transporter permease [Bacteroidales bacterium OttesenSCG-928-K22]MDL2242416.1 ABC transporter permease [Bacteroidales bacterium OttesenSCG-928-K03]